MPPLAAPRHSAVAGFYFLVDARQNEVGLAANTFAAQKEKSV
ncbi:MAG: hypothetical protein Q8L26_07010 [Candidatus Omnitrophota bacterium]|nr:hypothetical protein [Candidatus Omnitrophota bacterium]